VSKAKCRGVASVEDTDKAAVGIGSELEIMWKQHSITKGPVAMLAG
jgi:hypothetical protein